MDLENHSQVKLKLIMLQSLLSRSALIFLSATLTFLTVACAREGENLTTQEKQNLVQHKPDAKKSNPTVNSKVNSQVNSQVNPSSRTTPNSTDSQSNLDSDAIVEQETEPSFLEKAQELAAGASNIGQTAQSSYDWQLVITRYQDAIALLRKIPRQSIDRATAQTKIAQYQREIKHAQQQASLSKPGDILVSHSQEPISGITEFDLPQIISESKPERLLTAPEENYPNTKKEQQLSSAKISSPPHLSRKTSPQQTSPQQTFPQQTYPRQISSELGNQGGVFVQPGLGNHKEQVVFSVPIKRRVGGTPVIEVNFNGDRQFEMIVDTGASGTVITQKMAKSLGVEEVGKAQANTASAKAVEFPIGYVDSIETAGVQVHRVAVAIAGKELEVGLLGHDFFGNYDLTIKRNVVELRPQFHSQLNSSQINSSQINPPQINSPQIDPPQINYPEIEPSAPTSPKQPQKEEFP